MSRARNRLRIGLLVVVVAIGAVMMKGLLLEPVLGDEANQAVDSSQGQPATNAADSRTTETITAGDLTESKEEGGTISYGASWPAPLDASGVVTKRHAKGSVIQPGEPLIWLGTQPVFLATGDVPVYREMLYARDEDKKLQTGDDVAQLQTFLLAQGYDDKQRLAADGEFGPTTQRAVKAWQKDNGLLVTGRVDRTQLVFHPRAVRIDSEPMIGAQFTELLVSNEAQTVTANFDNRSSSFVPLGGSVELTAEGVATVTGTIQKVESVNQEDGSRVFRVEISPDAALDPSVERVEVVARKVVANNVLLVPARSIVALSGSGYAVEVRTDAGSELRRVELGSFVDDMVEIDGDIDEGLEVIVPGDGIGDGQ